MRTGEGRRTAQQISRYADVIGAVIFLGQVRRNQNRAGLFSHGSITFHIGFVSSKQRLLCARTARGRNALAATKFQFHGRNGEGECPAVFGSLPFSSITRLATNDVASRNALYGRARKALVTQLREITPALTKLQFLREQTDLGAAIRKVEAQHGWQRRRRRSLGLSATGRSPSNAPRTSRAVPARSGPRRRPHLATPHWSHGKPRANGHDCFVLNRLGILTNDVRVRTISDCGPVKAGVIPQLERDRGHWIVVPAFRPERQPLTGLAKALAERAGQRDGWRDWRDRLAGSEARSLLAQLGDDLRIADSRGATLLLPIDQFEEAFTAADPQERECFLNVLALCVGPEAKLPYLAIATIRSDMLTGILQTHQLTLPFEDFLLAPMAINQIPKIVEGPTGVAALTVEKGLPHRVAEDVKSADALPLLAFALRELFERYGRERRLTIADYEKHRRCCRWPESDGECRTTAG